MVRRLLITLALSFPLAGLATALPAQSTGSIDPAAKRSELARLEDEAALSQETLSRLEGEVKAIENDTLKLRAELVETGQRMREAETAILSAEARIQAMAANEEAVKASLNARRGTLIEVIATLQRMGRRPPPALLVRPDDVLEAIRTAMLLGAVLPEMRDETNALVADLNELVRVRRDLATERDGLKKQLVALVEDRERVNLLLIRRHEGQAARQAQIDEERQRAAELGRNVSNLKELIARMEKDVGSVQSAAQQAAQSEKTRTQLATLEDPNRLVPAQPFEKTKGSLQFPVSGPILRGFGDTDPVAGEQLGVTIAALPSATVSSPCDGWVVFAGEFRSYGKLLIINAGDGYHILLAGLERIDVDLGQFVLTGEPVGVMGTGEAKVATAGSVQVGQPAIYVEFRKNNVSIDPGPWWSKKGEKARG